MNLNYFILSNSPRPGWRQALGKKGSRTFDYRVTIDNKSTNITFNHVSMSALTPFYKPVRLRQRMCGIGANESVYTLVLWIRKGYARSVTHDGKTRSGQLKPNWRRVHLWGEGDSRAVSHTSGLIDRWSIYFTTDVHRPEIFYGLHMHKGGCH